MVFFLKKWIIGLYQNDLKSFLKVASIKLVLKCNQNDYLKDFKRWQSNKDWAYYVQMTNWKYETPNQTWSILCIRDFKKTFFTHLIYSKPLQSATPQSADPASLRLALCYTPFGPIYYIQKHSQSADFAICSTILLGPKISRLRGFTVL